jgi:hypothetical protein
MGILEPKSVAFVSIEVEQHEPMDTDLAWGFHGGCALNLGLFR